MTSFKTNVNVKIKPTSTVYDSMTRVISKSNIYNKLNSRLHQTQLTTVRTKVTSTNIIYFEG
jgi:hypothetical protein